MTKTRDLAAAVPMFRIGQKVRYQDYTNRPQTGRVQALEANWRNYTDESGEVHPHLVYQVEHPSYSNGRIYLSEEEMRPVTIGE